MPKSQKLENDLLRHIALWRLTPDGSPIVTQGRRLLPVRWQGRPAMLKVTRDRDESCGAALMAWWDGDGAAKVFAHEPGAILLERALGGSLAPLARRGRDDEATRIICSVVARLHAPRPDPPVDLVPLSRSFEALEHAAASHGGVLARSSAAARELLADPRDIRVLHGDIHHGNILDFGERGWLAIDPKRLIGERGFDYANLFCNPDLDDPAHPAATLPGRFARRLEIVSEAAGIEQRRLAKWVLAWAGLSAAWFIDDGMSPEIDLKIAELAAAALA